MGTPDQTQAATADAGAPAPTPAAAPVVTPPAAPAAPAAAPVADPPAKPADAEPPWLAGRLERERRATLKAIGIDPDNADDAKAALEAHRAATEAQKSEVQKLTEANAALQLRAKRAEELEGAVATSAEAALATLTDQQREAVKALAGDDVAKVSNAIAVLAPTWAAAPANPAQPPAAPAAKPPADTAPGRTAPSDTTAGDPPDLHAQYVALKSTDPFAASRLMRKHGYGITVPPASN